MKLDKNDQTLGIKLPIKLPIKYSDVSRGITIEVGDEIIKITRSSLSLVKSAKWMTTYVIVANRLSVPDNLCA